MNSALILGIVLLASFGLLALLLSGLVAIAWQAGLRRMKTAPADVLALRLLPMCGALLVALTIVLPAFLSHEPPLDHEAPGPLLLLLAAFAVLILAHGIWRGWRAWTAARSLLQVRPTKGCLREHGQIVHVIDSCEPIVGVVGAWRPRLVTAECVISACSPDELRQVVAHEAAHVSARDNLKLLLILACPDPLAWTPLGAEMLQRWRSEAEFAADQLATGDDPHKRVALAAALIKVARLLGAANQARHPLSMPVALDDVEARVRQLLGPAYSPAAKLNRVLVSIALLAPLAALPGYAPVHELIEALVRFGL